MLNFFKEILRGIFIGVANIIPGVSGGTIALSMGVYEKIIFAINNLRKDFKNSIKTLIPYAIGMVLGIVLLSFLIDFCLKRFELPTLMAFVGLILGGLPPIIKRVENEKFKLTHLISFVIFALIIIVPTLIANNNEIKREVSFSFTSCILLFVLGIIGATTMVVPGVSGSMVLMMLGYYNVILGNITAFIKAFLVFNISEMLTCCGILVPFGFGVIAGIFLASKIIEKLLTKYPNATMWGIIALVVTSPFAILWGVNLNISVIMLLSCLVTFAIGFLVARKLSK